jgi:hypothetical protein
VLRVQYIILRYKDGNWLRGVVDGALTDTWFDMFLMKQNCIYGEQKLHECNIKMEGISIFSFLCIVSLHMLPPFITLPHHF